MAEFALNNVASETTGISPFLADSGQHPRMGFEPPFAHPGNGIKALQIQEARGFVEKMENITTILRHEMNWAQARHEQYANTSRQPNYSYQVGDRVWLDARNIQTKRPSKKLDWKNLGPFTVSRVVSNRAYRLELPAAMGIHPTFHPSLLRPVKDHLAHPGQIQPPPPPIEVDGVEEYTVERILQLRFNRRRKCYEYLVQWLGYEDPTWEPINSVGRTTAVDKFHENHPIPQDLHLPAE